MRFLHNAFFAALAALTVFSLAQVGFAADEKNSAATGAPQANGTVTCKVTLADGSAVSVDVPITLPMTAREKALEIENKINANTKYVAKVNADPGSTITVTSTTGLSEVRAVNIDAGTTKEFDKATGKQEGTSGTGTYLFSGTVGTPGTVSVGAGTIEFDFDVSTFSSIEALRTAVASTLTANGFSAYVGPEGTIFATIPAGMDGVGLGVFCDTMRAGGVGYLPAQ